MGASVVVGARAPVVQPLTSRHALCMSLLSTMSKPVGCKRWAIAEGYIPAWSNGKAPEMVSHEAVCLLNASEHEAHVEIMVYFEDRDPAGPFRFTVHAARTKHIRLNELADPERIPPGVNYSTVIESDVPIVVQHTRLDSRQAENALMTTIAYADRCGS